MIGKTLLTIGSWLVVACGVLPVHGQCRLGFYGSGLNGNGWANQRLLPSYRVSYRFRAGYTRALVMVRNRFGLGSGYSTGTGGCVRLEIREDDGSREHLPSDTVLAWQDVDDPASNNVTLPIFVFEPRPSLIAGRIYHLVFRNVTGEESPVCSCSGSECNPVENYVSVGQIYTPDGCDPQQPTISEMDLATLISGDAGQTWSKNCSHTPVFSIWYDDQTQSGQGVGYLGARSGAPRSIGGLAKVRERFQIHAARASSVRVSELSIRVRRISEDPTDLRVLLLEVIEGMRVELFSSEIKSSAVSQEMTWIT